MSPVELTAARCLYLPVFAFISTLTLAPPTVDSGSIFNAIGIFARFGTSLHGYFPDDRATAYSGGQRVLPVSARFLNVTKA